MSKKLLEDLLSITKNNITHYYWKLYIFKTDKRNKENPYFVSAVKFRDESNLQSYVDKLINLIKIFQVDPIDTIQEYNGENTKVSCDKLKLDDPLIVDMWSKFNTHLENATEDKIKGKITGYVVCGRPTVDADENLKPIIIIKFSNPVISYKKGKMVIFKASPTDDLLDAFNEEFYRLYLTADVIVYNNSFYAFNHSFEPIFNLVKTMDIIRQKAIDKIATERDILSNKENFIKYAKSYPSSRTFMTLEQSKLDFIKNNDNRKAIAKSFKIELDEEGKIITDSEENVNKLIKYLCYKIIEEKMTNKILEVNNATEVQ